MFQIEEENADIALAIARLDDEDKRHFSSQKSAKIKRTGYSHYAAMKNSRKCNKSILLLEIVPGPELEACLPTFEVHDHSQAGSGYFQ